MALQQACPWKHAAASFPSCLVASDILRGYSSHAQETSTRLPAGLTTLSISSVVTPGFTAACAVSRMSRASLHVWRSVFSSFSLRMAAAAKQIWNLSKQGFSHVKGDKAWPALSCCGWHLQPRGVPHEIFFKRQVLRQGRLQRNCRSSMDLMPTSRTVSFAVSSSVHAAATANTPS